MQMKLRHEREVLSLFIHTLWHDLQPFHFLLTPTRLEDVEDILEDISFLLEVNHARKCQV